jgi:hypothetical protein
VLGNHESQCNSKSTKNVPSNCASGKTAGLDNEQAFLANTGDRPEDIATSERFKSVKGFGGAGQQLHRCHRAWWAATAACSPRPTASAATPDRLALQTWSHCHSIDPWERSSGCLRLQVHRNGIVSLAVQAFSDGARCDRTTDAIRVERPGELLYSIEHLQ